MHFDLCWLTGLKSTSRQEAIQTPSDWPTADQMIQVKHKHIALVCVFVCALYVSADVTAYLLSTRVLGRISKYVSSAWTNLLRWVAPDKTWLILLP